MARERATEDKPADAAGKLAAIRDHAVALGKRQGASPDPAAIAELRTDMEGLAAALGDVEPAPPLRSHIPLLPRLNEKLRRTHALIPLERVD